MRRAQSPRLDQGSHASDGRQGNDQLVEEDCAHRWCARAVRWYFGDVAATDDVLDLSLLGVRREQEDRWGWCVLCFYLFTLVLAEEESRCQCDLLICFIYYRYRWYYYYPGPDSPPWKLALAGSIGE